MSSHEPVRPTFLPFHQPSLGAEEGRPGNRDDAIGVDHDRSEDKAFEQQLADYVGAETASP